MPDAPLVTPFQDPLIKAAFAQFPANVRPHLLSLRNRIFANAARLEDCGSLTEVLKWGQPSYQTSAPRTGTPIRLGVPKLADGHYAFYVHCQTTLIETIRARYPDEFTFEGNRALVLQNDKVYSSQTLDHIIVLALMYHRP